VPDAADPDGAAWGGDEAARRHRAQWIRHWDEVARFRDREPGWGEAYRERLTAIYRLLVPPGRRVLELGCGRGDLLAALQPAVGVGVDFSPEMLARGRVRHPQLRFVEGDVHDLDLDEPFDVILLADLANELWDVQQVFERLRPLVRPRTRLVINTYSRLWELPSSTGRRNTGYVSRL
jgi:ubiquinone/menaquinone biosynthesis C-methylase UbiE